MKQVIQLIASALLTASASLAHAQGGYVPPPIASAAGRLVYASQQLAGQLSGYYGGSAVANDAVTLFDAAEHFQQEVQLGPQDLGVDFNAIESTYDQLQMRFNGAWEIEGNPALRAAWFQVQEANIALRQAWFGGSQYPSPAPFPQPFPSPFPNPTREIACYAQNVNGQLYTAFAYDFNAAQQQALQSCEYAYNSYGCRIVSCR